MKSSLNQTFRMLALIAILTCGGSLGVRAHDLPSDRLLAVGATADCLAMASRRPPEQPIETAPVRKGQTQAQSAFPLPLASTTVAFFPAYQSLLGSAAQPAATLSALIRRVDFWLEPHTSQGIAVIAPDAGKPPRPSRKVLAAGERVPTRESLVEVYMPYDFNMSDWRFGQFSQRCQRSDHAWSPVVVDKGAVEANDSRVDPTIAAAAIGQFLTQVESLQCIVSEALHSRRSSQASIQPLYQEPQFVVFESAAGKSTVLTVAQAKAWSFVVAQKSRASDNFVRATLVPVKEQAINATSRQLKSLGSFLISLSNTVAGYSQTNLASNNQPELR